MAAPVAHTDLLDPADARAAVTHMLRAAERAAHALAEQRRRGFVRLLLAYSHFPQRLQRQSAKPSGTN